MQAWVKKPVSYRACGTYVRLIFNPNLFSDGAIRSNSLDPPWYSLCGLENIPLVYFRILPETYSMLSACILAPGKALWVGGRPCELRSSALSRPPADDPMLRVGRRTYVEITSSNRVASSSPEVQFAEVLIPLSPCLNFVP